ncbi:flagellar basal body-associated protein FliL [Rhodobacteraceae bacterium RKSG542]|uniref:flagellar basal body-associated FliL family protein n=1 Tax=Pseudovibrio flavus TaxID=2529854 RepID=UPI0012BC9E9D|nr:flagellar basal body-associated FliL family protein [Pseudovibrio flavus]MTI19274.1 flagellar basal body-associated protein FliL [Pseudovibrio flavus]
MANTDSEELGQEPKSSKWRLVIIGAAIALVVGLGAGAYYLTGGLSSSSSSAGVAEEDVPEVKPVVFYDLPEMVVNLATDGRRTYLKVQISLELQDDAMVDRVEPFLPRIMDAFQIYLRELRPADLEGSAGLFRLKEQLLRRINLAVYPARVEGVLFKEILIQ